MSDHLYLDDRFAPNDRHITVTIGGAEYPGFVLGSDPDYRGWEFVRVALPEGYCMVHRRVNSAAYMEGVRA